MEGMQTQVFINALDIVAVLTGVTGLEMHLELSECGRESYEIY